MSSRKAAHIRRQLSVDYPRYPPANSQTQQPPPQSQAMPLVSDYESDTQGFISDYPSKPPPRSRTNAELNLSVLKRHNPEIASILSIAAYAVIYEFSPVPEPTWSKTGVEGSLFICQLTPGAYNEDRYHAIVLNRRGLDNFEAELREGEDGGVEISDPYVIISCRDAHEQKIYGVFIFSEGTGTSTEQARAANGDLMKNLAVLAAHSRQAAEEVAVNARTEHAKGHVQEAESSLDNVPSSGHQISLQDMFGQNRTDDASWSVRAHNVGGAGAGPGQDFQLPYQMTQPAPYPDQNDGQQQRDILGDLFRKAGLR